MFLRRANEPVSFLARKRVTSFPISNSNKPFAQITIHNIKTLALIKQPDFYAINVDIVNIVTALQRSRQ